MFRGLVSKVKAGLAAVLTVGAILGSQVGGVVVPVAQGTAVVAQAAYTAVGGSTAVATVAGIGAASLGVEAFAQTSGEPTFTLDPPVDLNAVTDETSDYLGGALGKVLAFAIGVMLVWKLFKWLRRAT